MQLGLVGLGYAAVSLVAAAILFARHLQELRYPADASGGMWAFGDLFLWAFIVVLFAIPSVFLVWVIAKFESAYKIYSRTPFSSQPKRTGLSRRVPITRLGRAFL